MTRKHKNQLTPQAREAVRCKRCQLVQFRTVNDLCRKCGEPLPRPPKQEEVKPQIKHLIPRPQQMKGKNGNGKHAMAGFPVGPKLRELRDNRGLTQSELAREARVPRTYISRIENCHLLPGLTVLERIAGGLQVEITDFLPHNNGSNGHKPESDPELNRQLKMLTPEQTIIVLQTARIMLGLPLLGFVTAPDEATAYQRARRFIGRNVKLQREWREITLSGFARLVGITGKIATNLEQGRGESGVKYLRKIADVLSCSVCDLVVERNP